jgi:hypothetical protein
MNERRKPADPVFPIDERGDANRLPLGTHPPLYRMHNGAKFARLRAVALAANAAKSATA